MFTDTLAPRYTLPVIPLVDIGTGGPVEIFERERDRAADLLEHGCDQYSHITIDCLDALSRLWASYARNPHRCEVARIASVMPRGVWFMNFCLEWGCTSGIMTDPTNTGMRLLRTLDWPFHGLGRNLVVAKQKGPAGVYFNVTWPGFTGVVQAMAPGRFALALNQAPLIRHLNLPLYIDWLINRAKTFSSKSVPPVHLMRLTIETCKNYAEARELLASTPLALPAIFTLAGIAPGDGCIIERLERRAEIREAPGAAANHWINKTFRPGKSRGIESLRRQRLMGGFALSHVSEFDWLTYPIINEDTRLVMYANPNTGNLCLQGYEAGNPATQVFKMTTHDDT